MEMKIVLVLVVAITIGLCDAYSRDNIFGVKYETRYGKSELDEKFTKSDVELDVKEVASLVAGADQSWSLLDKFPVKELRELAEIESGRPIETCSPALFSKQSDLCKRLSGPDGSVHLSKYCNHCVDKRRETCSTELFNDVTERSLWNYKLLEYNEYISKYMKLSGGDRDPQEFDAKKIMQTPWLSAEDRDTLIHDCDRIEQAVQRYTSHLDTNGKKLAAYLKDNETTDRVVMYKRCLMVNDLYKDPLVRELSGFKLLAYSNRLSELIRLYGHPGDTEATSVMKLMGGKSGMMNQVDRRDFILQCSLMNKSIKAYTSQHDKDGKKLAAYLQDTATADQKVMYERCLLITRLYEHQLLG